jgi:hypothetical protein
VTEEKIACGCFTQRQRHGGHSLHGENRGYQNRGDGENKKAMKVLNINKTNILHDFKRLSDIWDSTENITLQLDIKQSETKTVVRALTSCLPNDLAYSIMSEIAENEKLDDDLMQLIFEKGDKGCKIAICLHEDLPQELKERCVQSADIDIKEHYMQGNVNNVEQV